MVAKENDEIVLATSTGMAIRFKESDARPTGRNTSGVKGISLTKGDSLVGMVVADPEATLLTACLNGYGKRTSFGPNQTSDGEDEAASASRYRTQNRGGKGLRDIKATERNGPVVCIVPVSDEDEILMMTARGKLQRISCRDIKPIGRNTQGVRIMSLDDGDTLAAVVPVPRDEGDADELPGSVSPEAPDARVSDGPAAASEESNVEAGEDSASQDE